MTGGIVELELRPADQLSTNSAGQTSRADDPNVPRRHDDPVDPDIVLGRFKLDVDDLAVVHDVYDLGRVVSRAHLGQQCPLEAK